VILEFLNHTLERPLSYRENLAIGLALDEAIAASVVMYIKSRDEHHRQLEERRSEQDKQVQRRLEQQTEALREADRRKNEFLATLAHELRNPLGPLRNVVGVLGLRPPPDATLAQVHDIIDRQVRQMARLVDDLNDVSRISVGKIELRKKPLNLAPVVTQATLTSEPFLKARGHHLEVNLLAEQLWAEADPARLVQILVNLLNNAAKYTDPGGHIRLTLAREGEEAVFRVRDTGVGITPEMLPHVFDLFTQAEWSLDRSQGGLGIGLTLVRRLVELHGGTIAAHSEGRGRGSEFVVRLPLAAAPLAERAVSPIETGEGLRRSRVLVVDDNVDAAQSLALLLQLWGHEVRTSHNGPAALETAAAFHPETVLLDLELPGMDGYEVARRLRERSDGEKMKLLAITGNSQEEDRRRAREIGFDAFLLKPVEMHVLQELLAKAVP
jgi:signal transduction histidine kinase